MKRIAQSASALVLAVGLAFGGFGSGFFGGGMTTNGATGCCRDAV